MARKKLSSTQRAYKQQIKRINQFISRLQKEGVKTKPVEKIIKSAYVGRPTKQSVEKLKRDFSAKEIRKKAGLVQVKGGWITKKEYDRRQAQRYKQQIAEYERKQKRIEKQRISQQKRQATKSRKELKQAVKENIKIQKQTAQFMTPPKESELIFNRITGMINDVKSRGSNMLSNLLASQIKKYGRYAVTSALESLPTEYIESMESLIKYGDDKQQNSLTIKHIAEAIKSEILSDAERMEIANTTDSEEDYGE